MRFRRIVVMFFATGLGVGYLPLAPGTFGSLLGLLPCWALSALRIDIAAVILLFLIIFSCWVAHAAEVHLKTRDPGLVVIDEIAGMAVTMIGLPFNPITAGIGFLFFRLFDVLKPFPIRWIDRKVGGGVGVVLDDVLAGIFANLILRLILRISLTL